MDISPNQKYVNVSEQIVMTPRKRSPGCTCLLIERKRVALVGAAGEDAHVAGGAHQGLVINKQTGASHRTAWHYTLHLYVHILISCYTFNARKNKNAVTKEWSSMNKLMHFFFHTYFIHLYQSLVLISSVSS